MSLVRFLLAYDPSGWRPVGALLRGLGVALAVWIGGTVGGGWGAGVLAGLGALYAGIASFGGVHRARLKRMVAAAVVAGLTTLVGCLVGPSDLATVVVVTLATFVLGLLAAAGPDAAMAAMLGTGMLIVFSGLPGASAHPLGNAALVLGGGLGQAAILMAFHPISPLAAEERAVEAVYRGLWRFARDRARGAGGPLPNVAAHAAARDLLRAGFGYDQRPERGRLWSEMELADALRGGFAGLDRVRAESAVWDTLATWLEEPARGRRVERRLPEIEAPPEVAVWLNRMRRTVEAEETGNFPSSVPQPGSWTAALRNIERLRALALGHALRYALAIGLAVLGYRLLKADHGYWAPLALTFSLKADFASTVTRSLGRLAGTAAGVLLATAMVAVFAPSHVALTAAMIAGAWAAFAFQNASFVLYSAFLAFYVVVSVTLSGMAVSTAGLERLAATAIGSALALGAAFVRPQWEAGKARQSLAVAFAAQAEYADAVASRQAPETLAATRLQARAARLEAERVVAAAGFEPRWSRGQRLEGAGAALARLAENAARILAAHVAALDPASDEPTDDLGRLAAEDRGLAADLMG